MNNNFVFLLFKQKHIFPKLLLLLAFAPLLGTAQKLLPRFESDTLYTTSGFKIYNGQILHFATGTGKSGNFRYVKIKTASGSHSLTGNTLLVKKLSDFSISGLGNGYIRIEGTIIYQDGLKGGMEIHLSFDRAIESFPGLPSELIVPEEFRNRAKGSVADEINKLFRLYQDSALTREEFETQKKKLLSQ